MVPHAVRRKLEKNGRKKKISRRLLRKLLRLFNSEVFYAKGPILRRDEPDLNNKKSA